jgi:hypothetical protein
MNEINSKAFQGMQSLNKNCRREMNRILELQEPEKNDPIILDSIGKLKKQCFMRTLCFENFVKWERCMFENNSQPTKCDKEKTLIYNCYENFWDNILNEQSIALFQHFQEANLQCKEKQKKYANCRFNKTKSECKDLFIDSEMCLVSKLDNKLYKKYLNCKQNNRSKKESNENQPNQEKLDECYKLKVQLVNLKYFWARQILLKMNFNQQDMEEEGVMDILEMISKQIHSHFF